MEDKMIPFSNEFHLTSTVDQQIKDYQSKWILSLKVINVTLSVILLALATVNFFNYLIKKKKYKNYSTCLMYISAVICIVGMAAYCLMTPITNPCAMSPMIAAYISSHFNLVFGICQAAVMTDLFIQLKGLFTFS